MKDYHRILRAFIFGLMLLTAAPAWATTRYADNTLGADCTSGNYSIASRNCTGSDGNAYNTIAEGLSPTVAGDTLYIRSGTWTEQIDMTAKAGAAGNFITVAGYPGETVTIRTTGFAIHGLAAASNSYFVFDNLVLDGVNAGNLVGGSILGGSHDITLQNLEIKNWKLSGIYIEADNIQILNCKIHDQISISGQPPERWYGIYWAKGSNGLIQGNNIYNNPGGGIQVYPGTIDTLTIRKNHIHDNNTLVSSSVGGIIVYQGGGFSLTNITIDHNLVVNNGSSPTHGISYGIDINTGVDNTLVLNNTVYGNANDGIVVNAGGGVTGTILQNNISLANGGTQITDLGSSTLTTNKTTGTITDCTVSTSDFTHKTASSCINAGTARSGFSYNGSAPDQGAFETFVFSACSVADATPTKVNILYTNNLNPPIRLSSPNYSARENSVSKTVSGSVVNGTNQVDVTVTSAFVNGTTIDHSVSSGVTDSALIGGTLNQPFLGSTNQGCANNIGAGGSAVLTQVAWQPREFRGTETSRRVFETHVTRGKEVIVGGSVWVRVLLADTVAQAAPFGVVPYSSKNGGPYNLVTDTLANNIKSCGTGNLPDVASQGTATTEQMSGAQTFIPGLMVRTSNAIPTVEFSASGQEIELDYCFSFGSEEATHDIELRKQDGSALTTYTVRPRITTIPVAGGGGF